MNGTRKARLAFGSVVTGELLAMPVAQFAEVVVAPLCFYSKGVDVAMIVYGDDFFTEGRAEALLQIDEHRNNKFRINLVSRVGNQILQACDRLQLRWPWTWTGDPTHC